MNRELPPLNGLRAFEAAARHLSFQKAARELNVTPAAISHQVKGLEDRLGAPLFVRLTRALELTETGTAALPMISDGLDQLAQGWRRMGAGGEAGVLTVSLSPTIASTWLVPRMPAFEARHPDIRIRMDATIALVDFEREDVDIAIRFGPGKYPGLETVCLFGDVMMPVCAPALMAGEHPLREPADLCHHTLLHTKWKSALSEPDWRMWLTTAGADEAVDYTRGPEFSVQNLAIEAAIRGQGVALASHFVVEDALKEGTLVTPFGQTLSSAYCHWVVYPKRKARRADVIAFRDWLVDEAAKSCGPDAITGAAANSG